MNSNPAGCGPWLPPKLWAKVFGYLRVHQLLRARLTCQNWKQSIDGCTELKQNIVLRIHIRSPIGRTLARGPFSLGAPSVVLDTMQILELPERWWPPIAKNLTSLELLHCTVPFSALLEMLQLAPGLKRLRLMGRMDLKHSAEIDPEDFRFPQLEELALEDFTMCEELAECFPALKRFEIDELLVFPEDFTRAVGFIRELQNSLESIKLEFLLGSPTNVVQAFREMNGLRLRSLKLFVSEPAIKSEVMAFLPTQPALTELNLSGVGISCTDFIAVCHRLPCLRRIRVSLNEPDPFVFLSFNAHMDNLHEMELLNFYPKKQSVVFLESRCSMLKRLSLDGFGVVVGDLQKFLQNSPNVHTVELNSGQSSQAWPTLFDAISRVAHVRISNVVPGDQKAYFSNRLGNLQTLELTECRWSEPQLIGLIQQCPNVVEFKLLRLECVTAAVLKTVCAHMRRLQKLAYEEKQTSQYDAKKPSFVRIIQRGYPPLVWFVEIIRDLNAQESSGFTAYMD